MTKNRKLLIAILIIATIVLAGISIVISTAINNNNLQSQTGAQTNPILANCNSSTNTCTIPSGVCNPSKVYVHFCSELKKDNEKCVSTNPIEIPVSPVASGSAVNLNDYLGNVTCGTVQMYLELENSGVNSLGACGTTVKKFSAACGAGTNTPVSFPASFPNGTNNTGTNTGTNTNTGNNTNNNGTTQLADPQFRITNSYAATCEASGDALLKYTISISNISTVSGTITKVEEVIDTSLISNGIIPTNVSNNGTTASNKITWAETSAERTYNANQTKTLSYEIRIPKAKLATFQNGTNSNATVTYNTSNTTGNTNTFALLSKHSCVIQTTNTNTPSQNTNTLPNTALTDDFKLLLIGAAFILAAILIFRFQIGEDMVANLLGSKYRRKN